MTSRRGWTLGAAVPAMLAAIAVLPTLRAQFIYDDTTVIRDNTLLRGWSGVLRVWSTPYWPSEGTAGLGLYRPLQLSILSIIWNAGSGKALWFHAYALLLAAGTAAAVWWLLRRGTSAVAAFAAAAWFATHPLHVEAIASVANTSELLVVCCAIAMTALLMRAAPSDRGSDWMRAAAVGVLAAAALAAKESGLLALPLAAVTALSWRSSRVPLRAFLVENSRAWMAGAVGVIGVLLARLVVLGAPVSSASIAAQGLGQLSGIERARTMISLWPRIAGMLVFPRSLSPYYGPTVFPAHQTLIALVSLAGAALLISLAVLVARRGDARPLAALGWVALSYLPASNLLAATGQIISDRTLYGATVGVALLIAWTLDQLAPLGRRLVLAVVAIAAFSGAMTSVRYAAAWTSHRTLWAWLADAMPNEHLSYKLEGMDARARGDTARALPLLARAMTMAPSDRQIRFEYGQLLYQTGRYALAAHTLAPLIRDEDARSEPAFLALYLDAVGRAAGPRAVATAATPLVHSTAGNVAALFGGAALEQLGDRAGADSLYSAGLRRAPQDTVLAVRRAHLRATSGGPLLR